MLLLKELKYLLIKVFFSQSGKDTFLSTFYHIYLVIFITVFATFVVYHSKSALYLDK